MKISSVGSLSERSRLSRATGGTKVSGVVSLQKPRDRAEHRAFQYLLKSTPLHPTTSTMLWMNVTISG
jgi:hypothetical protein